MSKQTDNSEKRLQGLLAFSKIASELYENIKNIINMYSLKALAALFLFLSPHFIFSQLQENRLLQKEDITIRDPYIFADTAT